jgi:hypothetical protein
MVAAKRKKSGAVGGAKRPGGRPRGQHEVQDLADQVEQMMLYAAGRHAISRGLGNWLHENGQRPEPTPVAMSTVDDYIRRVKDRWAEDAAPTRAETRKRQTLRLHNQLRKAIADKRWRDGIRIEALIAKVEGNEANKTITLATPPGQPLKVAFPSAPPTSDDLRRKLAELLGKGKAGKALAGLVDED